jgi:glucose/arabinose dehydrogenase
VGEYRKSLYRTIAITAVCVCGVAVEARSQLRSIVHATGLSFPVAIVQDPTDPAIQLVAEQGGRIRVVRNGVVLATDFLDLRSAVSLGGERGLLGLALAPDYASSGRFFVNFTHVADGGTVVARFTRSADPLVANATSRFDLRWGGGATAIPQPFSNHNGGHLAFGPDGYLYIGLGDGGSGGDPFNMAQNPGVLLGKMLRIDVSVPDTHATGYQIPSDNPFVSSGPPGIRPEIWSVGWRNPWRYSFDDVSRGGTGALIVGDVGQILWEEIDYEPANLGGRNYGWDLREGAHDYDLATPPAYLPLTEPILEYAHAPGGSVTGGFVYRGAALGAAFLGRYFFADFSSGRVWSVAITVDPVTGEGTASNLRDHTSQLDPGAVSSFGVDSDGEFFMLSYFSGTVLKVEPTPPPSITATASVTTSGNITVAISNGPGFVSDWVVMVPAGSPAQTWTSSYMYLSGTKVRPATPLMSATLQFTAPATSGSFEFRFYQDDSWTLLATSGVVTVTTPSNPVPAVTALSPSSIGAGSLAFTLMVTGSGFVQGSQVRVNGATRTTTFVSATTLTAALPASDVSSAGALAISVFTPVPGGGTSASLNLTVTAPTLTINGSSGAVSVPGGSTLTVGVSNGPRFVSDWVMMVPAGSPAQAWTSSYMYLSGTKTRPATPMTSATLLFAAPTAGGSFEFRFYQNDTWTLLATSAVVTVTASAPSSGPTLAINGASGAVSVVGGSTITVGIVNGPGFASDWIVMVPAGSPAQAWTSTYMYLSGTKMRPALPMTSATLPFPAPTAGGSFEFRFYQNDSWTLLATSAVVTVTASSGPTLAINGSTGPLTVVAGSTIAVSVTNGPANVSDYLLLVPAGSPAQTWGDYKYLSGSRTRPATGMTSATVNFTAPAGGGTFEFRFHQNDGWTLLATSSQVTVTP